MKRAVFPLLCALFLCSCVSRAAEPNRFDGTWDTACLMQQHGWSSRLLLQVSVHGERQHAPRREGNQGAAGMAADPGKIEPDGTAKLYTNGLVGASEVAVGHRPPGTEYGYHVDAKFTDQEGSGKRVEGRPCEVTFSKTK